MTSQLNVDTIVDKAGSGGTNVKVGNTSTYVSDGGSATQNTVQSLCKVWVNFNGTGTIATRGSYNTSSITDGGTGIYDWAFTSNMSNGNYCVTASQGGDTNNDEIRVPTNAQTFAASGFEVTTLLVGSALLDATFVCMSVNGDLA